MPPTPWIIAPFVLLLALIALAPLFFAGWWGRHYTKVAVALALVTLGYYLGVLGETATVLHTGQEYVSFLALVGSLYVVSGGIHITVKGEATPGGNVCFLIVGGVLANVLGTTGAAMLLIRPWLRMNKYRLTGHHVVFFIFIVANVGGGLTPVGDPPLFAGYLKGVPFWWVAQHCWMPWATLMGLLLAMFYVVDRRNYLRAPAPVRERLAEPADTWRFEGLHNVLFLAVILGAVFIPRPLFLREGLMLAAAAGSWFTTARRVHEANHFDFHPIREVAVLFLGIFATMMPALAWLQLNAGRLGDPTPAFFYWGSGSLSAMLDNMPTYLCFLKAMAGAYVTPEMVEGVRRLVADGGAGLAAAPEAVRHAYEALRLQHGAALAAGVTAEQIEVAVLSAHAPFAPHLAAISTGAVYFGAATYIGNGPNFMVKAIAEQQHAHAPGFIGYILRYTLPFLLPALVVVWWLFFRAAR